MNTTPTQLILKAGNFSILDYQERRGQNFGNTASGVSGMIHGDRIAVILLSFVLPVCGGCAYTNVVPVAYGDTTTPGVRVFDQKPLLMVYDDSAEVILVPNYNRTYAVQFGAFLAKNDFKMDLENGSIKTLNNTLDSTAIIDLLKAIAQGLIPSAAKPSNALTTKDGHLNAVYDFDFDITGNIIGLRQIYFDKRRPRAHAIASAQPTQKDAGAQDKPNTSRGGGEKRWPGE